MMLLEDQGPVVWLHNLADMMIMCCFEVFHVVFYAWAYVKGNELGVIALTLYVGTMRAKGEKINRIARRSA